MIASRRHPFPTLARLVGGGAAALLLAAAPPVHADEAAHCQVRSIDAQPTAGGVDPKLADLAPKLTRPPFTEWKSFHLLAHHLLELQPGGRSKFALPDGREGELLYQQHLSPEGGKHRVRLQLDIRKGAQVQLQTVFVLDEGGTVLHAGTKHGNGILILGVSCSTNS